MRLSIKFISNLVIAFCLLITGCAQPVSDNPGLTKFSEYTFITSNQTSLYASTVEQTLLLDAGNSPLYKSLNTRTANKGKMFKGKLLG